VFPSRWSLFGLVGGGLVLVALGAAPGDSQSSPKPTGPNVIALWRFDSDAPAKDASGNGHDLQLQPTGSEFAKEGRFGGSLRVDAGAEVVDKAHGAVAADHDALSPEGAFSIEMWIRPDDRLATLKTAFLLDKKGFPYASNRPNANDDYLLQLAKAPGDGEYFIEAQLGFGDDSDVLRSRPVKLEAGQWRHLGYSYDGKGTSRFALDGELVGFAQRKGRGAISKGKYRLAIGDRTMSVHAPFSGMIDDVRLSNGLVRLTTDRAIVDAGTSRRAFYRLEENAALRLRILNEDEAPLAGASAKVSIDGVKDWVFRLKDIDAGGSADVDVPIDSRLQIGQYPAKITVTDQSGEPLGKPTSIELTIVPRPLPNEMPVVMWGTPNNLREAKEIGFTDCFVGAPLDFQRLWDTGEPRDARDLPQWVEARKRLDEMMALGLGGALSLNPARWAEDQADYIRVDREGKPYPRANVCGLFDRVQALCRNSGATAVGSLADMPALRAVLIQSELRDGTQLCFHDIDKEAYQQFSGAEIPAEVKIKNGVSYSSLPGFPADRVVPDDHPILKYLRWFWKQGDGWNQLQSAVHQGVKSKEPGLWTWFDPAIRVPSVWGSGGEVDFVSQWTYSYPDPLKIELACDDLLAMAEGRPEQRVMNMIQIIWYRAQTAPAPKEGEKPPANQAEWEKKIPDAKFISIAPDHLSEGMWLELSRPIKGIMNHGWGSLGAEVGYAQGSYSTANAETRVRLTEMIHKVVRPLGPTLMQVPDSEADVAFLQSFASQMLARRGAYGWGNSWGADAYMTLRYAAIQPKIVYDEAIARDGLDQYKVLVLADCDVLTRSVADAILAFQKRGGIIVGDERLAPAITPNIVMRSYSRSGKADADKAAALERAAKLRADLANAYKRTVDGDNPEVILRTRRYADADYVFAVNDHRGFGDYVGQHGLVMEKGLPARTSISLARADGHVYDLTESKPVADVQKTNGGLSFPCDLDAGQGRLFLVTSRPIAAAKVSAPERASAGDSIACSITIADDAGKPISAVAPVEIRITDARGEPCEYSGHYGAKDGKIDLKLDIPTNAAPGPWRIQARELASGRAGEAVIAVQ